MKQKRIRWRQRGSMVTNGHPAIRQPGDEDLMSVKEAKALEVCGIVEIIGDEGDMPEASVLMPRRASFEPETQEEWLDGLVDK